MWNVFYKKYWYFVNCFFHLGVFLFFPILSIYFYLARSFLIQVSFFPSFTSIFSLPFCCLAFPSSFACYIIFQLYVRTKSEPNTKIFIKYRKLNLGYGRNIKCRNQTLCYERKCVILSLKRVSAFSQPVFNVKLS